MCDVFFFRLATDAQILEDVTKRIETALEKVDDPKYFETRISTITDQAKSKYITYISNPTFAFVSKCTQLFFFETQKKICRSPRKVR